MKLVWVIFLIAASVATINCSSTKIRVGKKQENTDWNSEVQCVDDAELQTSENDLQKRGIVAVATVVGAIAAVGALLVTALSEMGNHETKIAIGISNETPYKWRDIDIEFQTGTSNALVPSGVPPNETLIYEAYVERLSGYGAAGVIALYIPHDEVTLCVLFSVPFDQLSHKNWWNVKSFLGKKNANENPCTFENLYSNNLNPLKGDDNRKKTPMDFYYSAEGAMSSGRDCTLELHIKKVAPGTAVSASTVIKAIPTVLARIGDYIRKISIGIINETPYEWERLNVYFSDGKSDASLPDHVPKGKGFNYSARKTYFSAYGAAGIIALHIPDDNISLCFLYSVPYSGTRSNWWNVKSFSGKMKANEDQCTFTKLYNEFNPVKGDDSRQTTTMDFYYSAEGIMSSSSSECTLELHIKKKVAPGTAVSAATVIKAIPTVLAKIGDQYSGKISIGIINETPYEWERLNVYFNGGTSNAALPDHVPTGKGFNYSAKEGAAGVIALYIKKDNKTVHIFFSVLGSKSKWNFAIHSGRKNANETWYYNLNKANPREGDDTVKEAYYTAKGMMRRTSSGSTLELNIEAKSVHYG